MAHEGIFFGAFFFVCGIPEWLDGGEVEDQVKFLQLVLCSAGFSLLVVRVRYEASHVRGLICGVF